MAWRKWLVRGLVFTVAACLAAGALAYQRFTNPTVVRRQVLGRLHQTLPGAVVSLDSAKLRLLGGIAFTDLTLRRRDEASGTVVLQVPSGIIYHDKEQLLHGELAIRKIELYRPRLVIEHRLDGSWNLAGILGPVRPDERIPTIVLQQATLVFEDSVAGVKVPSVEIRDVNLTLLNDPLPTVVFAGSGTAALFGLAQIDGQWSRVTGDLTADVQAGRVVVGKQLIRHLACYHAEAAGHADQLEGVGRIQVSLARHTGATPVWSHDLRADLSQGKLRHQALPQPLDQLDCKVRCLNGQVTLENLVARAGTARVEFQGRAAALDARTDFEGHLKVTQLSVDSRLFNSLPPTLQDLDKELRPVGAADVDFTFRRRGGKWTRRCHFLPTNLAGLCDKFRYPVQRITGAIDHEFDPARSIDETRVDLTGFAGGKQVRIKGKIQGEKPAGISLDLSGEGLALDETLMAALPVEQQKLARSFEPRGRADFKAEIRRAQGQTRFANRYVITFRDSMTRYAEFRYPIENVSGILDIQPDQWEFREFRGTHKGCEVRAQGRSLKTPRGDQLTVDISGSQVLLDEELETALKPPLQRVWKTLRPGGKINFFVRLVKPPGVVEPELDVVVQPVDGTLNAVFFAYPMEQITGVVRCARGRVELENLEARHGPTTIKLGKGEVIVKPSGGVWVELTDLEANPLVPDAIFLQALPPALERVCVALQLRQPMALRTRLVIDVPPAPGAPPDIYWDGGLAFKEATVTTGIQLEHVTGSAHCRGRHNGKLEGLAGNLLLDEVHVFRQPVRNVHARLLVLQKEPDTLVLEALKSEAFGGRLDGEIRIAMTPTPGYELNLTATQIRLEEFARHNLNPDAQMEGLASARLYLTGHGADLAELRGNGAIDVPSGRMYNLPFLLDLLKILHGRVPDRTAFEEAHAKFTIRGQRVQLSRIDLFGNAVSLGGRGEMNLDGSDINLDFHAVTGRLPQLLPPIIKEVPRAISQSLLKITARGRLGDVKFHKEPVPILVEPLRELIDRAAGKGQRHEEQRRN